MQLTVRPDLIKLVRNGLEVMSFDPAGRPLAAALEGHVYRRGLDGTVLCIDRVPDERFHQVARVDPQLFHGQLQARLEDARDRLPDAFPPLVLDRLRDEAVFRSLYRGVGILPPDRYRALVLNLTEGCSYNRCEFCSFYKHKRFQVRTPEQFRAHLREAVTAFGVGLAYRRGIFLGQANAASLPTDVLQSALEIIREEFPPPLTDRHGRPRHPLEFESVAAFLDTFTRPTRSVPDWSALNQFGLSHLYLGVESGALPVLKKLGKPGSPRFVRILVERLKQAGLTVSVIVMSGAGGWELEEVHVRETASLLNALPLKGGDRIYISELSVPDETLEHRRRCRAQTRALKERLRPGPLVSLYDVRQFVY